MTNRNEKELQKDHPRIQRHPDPREDHGGGDRRDDATGPLQDGENRGNTTRGDAGGGDHGKSR